MEATPASNKKCAGLLLALALIVLFCALPGLCLYLNNVTEMPFRDILLPGGCSVMLGLVCFFVCLIIFKSSDFAALVSVVGTGLFLNFNLVVDLVNLIHPFERLRPHYIAAAALFAALFCLLLLMRKKPGACRVLSRFLLLVTGSILAVCFVTNAPSLVRQLGAQRYHQQKTSAQVGTDMPNFYYILTDEYASFDQIKRDYGYDNGAFHDFLEERGFCVSDTSYNTYNYTMANLTESMCLDHVIPDKEDFAYQWELFYNAPLYTELENLGYDQCQIGNLFAFPALMPYFQSHATAENGAAAMEILITNSMLRPFSRALYWESVFESRTASFRYFDNPAHYAKGNRATYFYVCSPHTPFYRDADGGWVDMDDWMNMEDERFYLGQYIYMTGELEQMIASIQQNDPEGVILLQSDHGSRYVDTSMNSRRHILNALYMGKSREKVDITGLSGYNTFRVLLTAFGRDYPVLPEVPLDAN